MIRRSILTSLCVIIGLLAQGQGNGNGNGKPTDPGKGNGKPTDPGNSGGNGKNGGGNGKPTDSTSNGKAKHKSIEWLTAKADVEKALLESGEAEVEFKSSVELENLQVWLTPSLAALTVDPTEFETIEKDTVYTITLTLEDPPEHTLGGTIHLRPGEGGSRTYAPPYPLIVHVKGGDSEDQEEAVVAAVASSADYKTGGVSAGEAVAIFGSGIGPSQAQGAQLDSNGRVSTYLADTQVLFNGVAAPLLAASSGQVNAVVPQEAASSATVDVVVTFRGAVSGQLTLPVEPASPALFTIDGSGQGQSAALNQDGSLNSSTRRARRGTALTLFGTGFGEWSQTIPDGTVIGSDLPTTKSAVSVTIGGAAAKVLYAGGAPGLISGVVQLNVEVPTEIAAGDRVAVVVTTGGRSSSANVTVAVD